MNTEFIKVLKLKEIVQQINPICIKCNKKMKSKGQNQGFQCIKCGNRHSKKTRVETKRKLESKLYLPEISAHRHLTRPHQRIGKNNKIDFSDTESWFCVYRN